MKTRFVVTAALIVGIIAVGLLLFRHHTRKAAMLLTNGAIYTLNPSQPKAEAVAIKDGIVVGVGSARELQGSFAADTVIDLGGKPVYPGFIDSHAHLEGLGILLMTLDVFGSESPQEVAARVSAQTGRQPPGSWIRGRGWDQNRWKVKEFPSRTVLDAAAPENPVMLTRVDGHAVWVNTRVLGLAGIDRSTADPQGGKIIRDHLGEPTGVFVDNAMNLVGAVLPPPSRAERSRAVQLAVKECLAFGLTQVHDMGADSQLIGIYKELISRREFPFRVYAAIDGPGETFDAYLKTGPDKGDGRLAVRALKIYMDGALGSRGAALLQPYSDDPGNRGLTIISSDSLRNLAQVCLDRGFQLCVHAIGDRANNIVLSTYQKVFNSRHINGNDVRFRVEHAQVLDHADVPLFHKLGLLPMMQPTHCTSDMPWVVDRLGEARAAEAYTWRSLLEDGNIVPAGSDFPVESPNPLLGFYAAITRQDLQGKPDSGWHPEQRMTREEALKAFTIWGAYAAFQEEEKGSIEVGKWADLVVLSDDIMTIAPGSIPAVRVEKTYVAGELAWEASAPPLSERRR